MNHKEALKLLKSTRGRIFSAEFVKKDGSLRKINARLGVKKGVKGKGLAYNPADYGLMVVYDMQKKAFRTINIKTLRKVKFKGSYIIR